MEKSMVTAEDLLNNPPPGVDLTLVGGQALIYWARWYQQIYPEALPMNSIAVTYDVDFLVQMADACEACYRHWGGRLDVPAQDDHTPELGRLVFNADSKSRRLGVDLLGHLFRLGKHDVLKNRIPISATDPKFSSAFVLSEWGVLLNRTFNALSSKRYQHPEAIKQLNNAIVIHHCRIQHLLDRGEIRKAQSESDRLLKLAEKSKIGMRLFLDHQIDLLQAMPLQDQRFHPIFKERGLKPMLERVYEKRDRLTRDRERRGMSSLQP